MTTRFFLLSLLILSVASFSKAEDNTEEKTKFKFIPTGRVLIDGAFYPSSQKDMFKGGMSIPEARLGAKMEYGNWSSWIDVGFAYGKIGLRNMWIQYDFNEKNSLRVGNFLQPFGYQSPVTSNNKPTFEQPLVSALFTPGLQLGLMYTFHDPMFYSATAFHVESSALTNYMNYPLFNQQGYSLLTRFVVRNKDAGEKDKPIFHGGISLGYSTPDRHLVDDQDVHSGFTNTAYFPTKVSFVPAISAVIGDSKNRFKLSPELLLSYKRIALESQYFFQTIARRDNMPSFNAQGAYVTVRGILLGGDYGYDSNIAQLVNPKKHTLEAVADYNYASLSDAKAGIFGGRANSFSFTLNYYFNRYITARLNYTHTHTWDREDHPSITQNALQLRIMLLY